MEGSCADRHDIRKAVLFIGNGRIIFLQIRGIRRKCAQMSGKNGKKKFFLLLAGILLVFNSISSGVYAMELGGFDVMTGVDDVDDWSDWDEAETGSVAESGTSSGRDSGSGDTYGETGDTGWEESSEWETESRQEEPTGTENRANAANTEVMNQADTGGSVRKDQIQAGSLDSMDTDGYGKTYIGSAEINNQAVAEVPTDTPVPTPSPTIAPTAIPTPVPTEVPESEVNKVTEFHEEYRISPAECLKKMKLFYWKETVRGREKMEIKLNHRVVAAVISLRINGQEISRTTYSGNICIVQLQEDNENLIELAAMVPSDLSWTEIKKDAILSYNVF